MKCFDVRTLRRHIRETIKKEISKFLFEDKERFDIMLFMKRLCSFSPRLGKNEKLAADFLKETLNKNKIKYTTQKFNTLIPEWGSTKLVADGQEIECKNTSLVSGDIEGKENIVSSFVDLKNPEIKYNINFSPYSKFICTIDFYDHPSVAVKHSDVEKIMKSKEVKGSVKVKKIHHSSENILVGNKKDPKFLVFAHYDCIGSGGAVDNASGVAVAMNVIINNPDVLNDALFIFVGCEEITYDSENINGLGFRIFEKELGALLKESKRIYILDGLGNSKPNLTKEKGLINITFQINQLEKLRDKIFLMKCDVDKIFEIYRSDYDTLEKLDKKFLTEAYELLLKDIEKTT